jgi:uncharacterized membrane protein
MWYKPSIFDNEIITYLIISALGIFFSFFIVKQINGIFDNGLKKNLLIIFAGAIVLYGLFLIFMSLLNYDRMVSPSIDIQYFHVELWKLSQFTIPTYEWSQHFSPILFFIAPIYWIIKAAGILMFLQAIVFISGIVPIFLISKKYLRSRLVGLSLAFAYLAFGGTQFGIAYGFHEIMFFPTIFLWMYYFYTQKKTKLYILFVILSLFVKEEVSFIMIFWGIYLLLIKKDKVLGTVTSVFGVLWCVLCFQIIFPAFNPQGGFIYWGQYDQSLGSGFLGLVKFIIFKPLAFLKDLITPSFKIDTFFQSFGSFGFLLFLFPPSFIIVLPSLFEKLLSNNIAAMNGTHYSAALTGVTLVATMESLCAIFKNKYFPKHITDMHLFMGILIFYLAFFFNMLYGYYAFSLIPSVHRTGYPVGNVIIDPSDENLTLLYKIIDQIPKGASISAQYQIIPHINKPYALIHNIPNPSEDSDYVLFDTQLPPPVLTDTQTINDYLGGLGRNKNYKLVVNYLGIGVYKKINSPY